MMRHLENARFVLGCCSISGLIGLVLILAFVSPDQRNNAGGFMTCAVTGFWLGVWCGLYAPQRKGEP